MVVSGNNLVTDAGKQIRSPHFSHNFRITVGDTELETPIPGITSDYYIASLKAGLKAMDHTVHGRGGEESGLSLIEATDEAYLGGADPRRDGSAGGRASLEAPVEKSGDEATVIEESEDEGRI